MGNHQTLIPYTHKYQYRCGQVERSTILITGASSGLGKEMALEYSRRLGVTLILVARNIERLKETQHLCEKNGAKAMIFSCDLSNQEQCKSTCEEILKVVKKLDVLVLNAGINAHSKFQNLKELSSAHSLMNTNFFANLYLFKYLFPVLKQSKSTVVVINSMSGRVGLPDRSIYCASKFALAGFFDAIRTEDVPITVTMVYPPSIDTPMRSNDILNQNKHDSGKVQVQKRMSAAECGRLIILAADYGVQSFYFPTKVYAANYLYPIFPKLIRQKMKQASKL